MEQTKQITTPITPLMQAVYSWDSIKLAMCEVLGISENDFRDYHNVIGGDYKDCWHVVVSDIFYDDIENDTIVDAFTADIEFSDDDKWKEAVINAWNQVIEHINKSNNTNSVKIAFDW